MKEKENKQRNVEEFKDEPMRPSTAVVVDCMMLNIREKPDMESKIIEVVPVGTVLTIGAKELGKPESKQWLQVRTLNGIEGYCMEKYLSSVKLR